MLGKLEIFFYVKPCCSNAVSANKIVALKLSFYLFYWKEELRIEADEIYQFLCVLDCLSHALIIDIC